MCVQSTVDAHASTSVATEQHPSHSQQFHLHLATLGKTTVQQRSYHQLHGALQPSGNHKRLPGLLPHQVSSSRYHNPQSSGVCNVCACEHIFVNNTQTQTYMI